MESTDGRASLGPEAVIDPHDPEASPDRLRTAIQDLTDSFEDLADTIRELTTHGRSQELEAQRLLLAMIALRAMLRRVDEADARIEES
ncbi:hypothetical protein NUU61_008792 [Penicillium alfredii]|uniref:Uncharacterized protein n=1 Tax=Penicillium alfredii TaxID=1506179 RepID=A0A9W9ELT9_9EURO|nr:uncharacterized protein NUU61_008792 [Penicillium alfredii]KAJ5084213.1 hypothetical protein NUU61_008792 [Penicillium alfredii]